MRSLKWWFGLQERVEGGEEEEKVEDRKTWENVEATSNRIEKGAEEKKMRKGAAYS